MKKLLAMCLVLGMATLANATILDVVIVDTSQSGGRDGSIENPLEASDIVEIAIVTTRVVYTYNEGLTYPAYDGPLVSSLDLDLHVTGPGTFSFGLNQKGTNIAPDVNANISPWELLGVSEGGFDRFGGTATNPIGPDTLVLGNMFIHCDGVGTVDVDLTWAGGLAEYKPTYLDNWTAMDEDDLGDLVLHQIPEPFTMSLLGLGGLALIRRRKA